MSVRQRVDVRPSVSTTSQVIIIAKDYLESPLVNRSEKDILKFWANYQNITLKKIALKNLVSAGSSVCSERVFSTAGKVICDNRSRLRPEKYNKLIFLKQNSWLY